MDIKLYGRSWVFGDNIDTGTIISSRFMTKTDNSTLGNYCLIDERPDFTAEARPDDILVAGKNFGCGSSREHAPVAIKQRVSCVIAESFARIFFRNSVNLGLHVIELPEATKRIRDGDLVEVDLKEGKVINKTSNQSYQIVPMPPFMEKIYEANGLYGYIANRYAEMEKDREN